MKYTILLSLQLGNLSLFQWHVEGGALVINLPDKATVKSEYAWTLKFTMNTDFEKNYEHTIFT